MRRRVIPVEELLETPAGRDEVGTPDHAIEHCEEHDVFYRMEGACLACGREEDGR